MRKQGQRGYTLLEIVITLVLATIVIGLVGSLFVASLGAWRRGQDLREAQIHASGLVDLIARDVRNASQTPSVTVRPKFTVEEGDPLLSVAASSTAPGGGPAWVLYLYLSNRGQVLRQVVTASPDGQLAPRESRVVGTGVTKISVEQVADGVTIQTEVRRGRATAEARATAAPRNP